MLTACAGAGVAALLGLSWTCRQGARRPRIVSSGLCEPEPVP